METVKPPIHSPAIESSIPRYSDNPKPAPTATTQTGQIAFAGKANRRLKAPALIIANFFFILFLEEIYNILIADQAIFSIKEKGNA